MIYRLNVDANDMRSRMRNISARHTGDKIKQPYKMCWLGMEIREMLGINIHEMLLLSESSGYQAHSEPDCTKTRTYVFLSLTTKCGCVFENFHL